MEEPETKLAHSWWVVSVSSSLGHCRTDRRGLMRARLQHVALNVGRLKVLLESLDAFASG